MRVGGRVYETRLARRAAILTRPALRARQRSAARGVPQLHRMRHERFLALRELATIHAMPSFRLQRPAPMEPVHTAAPVVEHHLHGLAVGRLELDNFLHSI